MDPPLRPPTLETLDFNIRIDSTPTFSYFDLYLYSAYAAHYVYLKTLVFIRFFTAKLKRHFKDVHSTSKTFKDFKDRYEIKPDINELAFLRVTKRVILTNVACRGRGIKIFLAVQHY